MSHFLCHESRLDFLDANAEAGLVTREQVRAVRRAWKSLRRACGTRLPFPSITLNSHKTKATPIRLNWYRGEAAALMVIDDRSRINYSLSLREEAPVLYASGVERVDSAFVATLRAAICPKGKPRKPKPILHRANWKRRNAALLVDVERGLPAHIATRKLCEALDADKANVIVGVERAECDGIMIEWICRRKDSWWDCIVDILPSGDMALVDTCRYGTFDYKDDRPSISADPVNLLAWLTAKHKETSR